METAQFLHCNVLPQARHKHHRRISAAVEQHHDLLFFLQPLADLLGQFARDDLLLAGLLKFLPHVDDLDFGQRTLLDAVGQLDQRVFIFLRVVIGLERRRGRAEHDDRSRHFGPHDRYIAGVIARRFFLLVRRILLLIDDDERQIADRRKHSRPRSRDYSRLAAPYAMPLLGALRIRQVRNAGWQLRRRTPDADRQPPRA